MLTPSLFAKTPSAHTKLLQSDSDKVSKVQFLQLDQLKKLVGTRKYMYTKLLQGHRRVETWELRGQEFYRRQTSHYFTIKKYQEPGAIREPWDPCPLPLP